MWKVNLNIFIYVLYVQAFLVITTVVITYILYYINKVTCRIRKKRVRQIIKYLLSVSDPKLHAEKLFKKQWKRLDCLVLALEAVDKTKKDDLDFWKAQRQEFIKEHMLPLARKSAKKFGFFSRFLAAKTFAMFATSKDEKLIAQLIQDRKPAVSIESSGAIVHLPTGFLLNILIDKIATLRRKSYELYLEPHKYLPESARDLIVNRLKSEKDPYIRDICYKMLMFFAPYSLGKMAYKDAESDTIDLRLSAIHYIVFSEGKKALSFLHQLLDDPKWEIKVVVLQELARLCDKSSVETVTKLLDDPEWWVKVNAKKTLEYLSNTESKT